MKLLLYSDFKCMPIVDVKRFLPDDGKKKVCLFCTYADDEAEGYNNRAKAHLEEIFDEIIVLTPDFDFKAPIDCVFINGGYNYELSYKLKKYNQFDKIKELARKGVLYIGNSAGSVMVGNDFSYTLEYDPPRIEMNFE